MPDLRARETNLRNQIDALNAQLADREVLPAPRDLPNRQVIPT